MLIGLVPALAAQERPWSTQHLSSRIPRPSWTRLPRGGARSPRTTRPPGMAPMPWWPCIRRKGAYGPTWRAGEQDDLWEVTFGRLSVDRDTFVVSYRAVRAFGPNPKSSMLQRLSRLTPIRDISRAQPERSTSRPTTWVASRAPITRSSLPSRIPADGMSISCLRPPERGIGRWEPTLATGSVGTAGGVWKGAASTTRVLEYGPPGKSDSAQLAAGYHSAVLDDRPEGPPMCFWF